MQRISVIVAAVALVVFTNSGRAQELLATDGFGSLAGKVTLVGAVPKVLSLEDLMKKHADKAVCCAPKTKENEKVDLTWIVDPKTKAVANVMVWVTPGKGKYFPIHDKLKKRNDVVVLDQPHCQFLPRISAYQPFYIDKGAKIETGQKLLFKNSAAVPHNVRVIGNGIDNVGFNKNLPPKTELEDKLNPQRLPIEVRCDIHTWMTARLFVFDHPYYALTDEKGNFEIPMVPAGAELTVMAWHEGVGYVLLKRDGDKLIVGAKKTIEKNKKTTMDIELQYNPGK